MIRNSIYREYRKNPDNFSYPNLKIGRHQYFNKSILKVNAIPTFRALCYKIEYESLIQNDEIHLIIDIPNSDLKIDKMESIKWFAAAKNTWQGVVTENWPYNHIPLKSYGEFIPNISNYHNIKLKDDFWKFRGGNLNFEACIKKEGEKNIGCTSIFHNFGTIYSSGKGYIFILGLTLLITIPSNIITTFD